MDEPTPRQQQVLDYIHNHLERHGYPPTLREIAAHLGVNGTLGVSKHLEALERKGHLRRHGGSSRGLSLARPPHPPGRLPIVGRVQAGALQPAFEELEGHFCLDPQLTRPGDFLLRVRGDSMIEAGIHDGDLAQVRPGVEVGNGDIVVALVDDEATLKRFFREAERLRLQPENRTMAPILISPQDGEVRIVGKVVGLFRRF